MKPPIHRPVRTQFIIFTLFGDYISPRGGTIWTSDLLYLLELLDVSERAARSALSRMTRKNWLTGHKQGRRSQYSLTARGWGIMEGGERRIFELPFADWDGLWQLVVYSLPEKKRKLRRALYRHLVWLGFGRLAPATWISPHNHKTELESIFDELGIQEYVEVFSGMRMELSSDQALVQNCWDLPGLEAEYRDFIVHYRPEYETCRATENGRLNLSPELCFVRSFWLTHDFQYFPLKDPGLPSVLLSADWVGFTARRLFEDYRRLLGSYANQFVDAVVKEESVNYDRKSLVNSRQRKNVGTF